MQPRYLLILFVTLFIVMAGFGIIIPILPFYSLSLGANPFHIGLLMATYSLMQFIFSPIWGSLSDRYGRKPIILIGLFGFSLSFTLFGLANSLWLLFASRIAGGILSSACLPTAMAYIADVTTEEERGSGMGMMGAAMGLGMVVGPAIGGLFSAWHLGLPFFFAAGVAAINFIFAALFLKESKKPHPKAEIKYTSFHHLFSLKGYMAFIFLIVFLASFSMSSYEGTFSLFAQHRFNYGAYQMGLIFTVMGLIGVIIQGAVVGRLIKRSGEETVIRLAIGISLLGYILTSFAYNGISLVIFVCLVMIGQGLMRPSLASIISKNTALEEGATMGLMQSVDSFGRIVGPIVAGFLFQQSINLPYQATAGFNILILFSTFLFF